VVAVDDAGLPFLVVDAAGVPVEPAAVYLRDLMLGDASAATCRSYAVDLLRWFRLLAAVDVAWDRVTQAEVVLLVSWLRCAPNPQRRRPRRPELSGAVNARTGKAELSAGYARSTINHALTVVSSFYEFHARFGRGPVCNPVPVAPLRQRLMAHRSPLEPAPVVRRAPLRQKMVAQAPRSIPDDAWDELFDRMGCTRDRALLASFVSSGARAQELLRLTIEDIDWPGTRLWVVSKGSGLREPVPVSPLALQLLAQYVHDSGLPAKGTPVWRTRRGAARPMSYAALRRVVQRANEFFGY
jgi:integrase